jgi:tRNA threonylcarbamoyladenosine biosynthesis protein TsaE
MTVMTRPDSPRVLALPDLAATAALGRALASLLRPGDVVALKGGLGAGKTTLVRDIVAALSPATTEVPSPTFTLVQTYPVQLAGGPAETQACEPLACEPLACELWHFDLYRLDRPEQIYELGLEEALSGAIAVIEWPELIERLLPSATTLTIELRMHASGARQAVIGGGSAWTERLAKLRSADPS